MASLESQVLRVLCEVWNPLGMPSEDAENHYLSAAFVITGQLEDVRENGGDDDDAVGLALTLFRLERELGAAAAVPTRAATVRILMGLSS